MLYTYTAVDKTGKSTAGKREAGSAKELAEALKSEGFFLVEAKEKKSKTLEIFDLSSVVGRLRGVTLVERMMFARNLAVMVGAGLPLSKALSALEEQVDNPRFKEIISDIRSSIVQGKSFAEALSSYEDTFGSLFVNMVESGEASGKLEYTLKLLARQMKRDHDLISKVRGALIYPAIIVGALVLIGALMMIYVVPILTQTFRELGISLPFTTRIIIGASEFLSRFYLLALGLTFVAFYAAWRFAKTALGRKWWGALSLKLPIFGALIKKLNSARFARVLSSLISSGLPIAKALEITSRVLGNARYKESLKRAAEEIQKGRALSLILKERPELYPPLVTQMLEVGEETGTTSRMLLRLAIFYETEVSNTTKNLSSIIEPVLMLVIGALVGFFAISMIQPIYSGLGGL